ncbi:MAG: NAD-dependent deacylase [Proteobacteria bacterium]|uniref:NAD-dependent protein deacylase n=1 Tax=Candidatus Avisuccinivibrio stercorigallinarum TaxID=2840704 RepID=A0A9D9DAC2_9GAMM|nr:NAD-dependent deacylase [Candidatus Avisuccinivibrio stercorigallinarum]
MDYKNIVVLTGAGISAESGIPVFRSETGLWENHRIEDVCVPAALVRNPKLVHDFYNGMRRSLKDKKPNPAHFALAKLQKEWTAKGGTVTLVTQNIDDLHEKAGSTGIIHMHGELNSIWCTACNRRFPYFEDSTPESVCPYCGKKALRPDIVFFEETPYRLDEITRALNRCDLFLSIGTSGVVYPAAAFCQYAGARGAQCIEFNLDVSAGAAYFDYGLYGKASETLPRFVDELVEKGTLLRPQSWQG